ncbi:hypothetical protein IQ22_02298 [Pseudomonas duriflava]|uniref:Uncharacterized protein n=1 Tax=Pseudomonas duriflava TaxID=459528 RepID=A0A562QAE2_9PSED|nr:hypothetical protein [Pseudomonas duriflava]TWI53693.1 hypothetical protein IQ22_02298 [Pseudomonas duriflava]
MPLTYASREKMAKTVAVQEKAVRDIASIVNEKYFHYRRGEAAWETYEAARHVLRQALQRFEDICQQMGPRPANPLMKATLGAVQLKGPAIKVSLANSLRWNYLWTKQKQLSRYEEQNAQSPSEPAPQLQTFYDHIIIAKLIDDAGWWIENRARLEAALEQEIARQGFSK